jgi:hypothetical protein
MFYMQFTYANSEPYGPNLTLERNILLFTSFFINKMYDNIFEVFKAVIVKTVVSGIWHCMALWADTGFSDNMMPPSP